MKNKILIFVCLFFITLIILWRVIFVNTFCGFYNICEWGIYLFIVPTAYILLTLFSKPQKQLVYIGAITLGIIISILLTRDWATGFILHKLISTILGSLVTCLIINQFKEKTS